jgi:putative endonuclease
VTVASQKLGARGEELAALWYRDQGYTVVERNWRCRSGEIDLVASREAVIVFCEVKTRSSRRYGHPAEAVTVSKQRRIRRLAMTWLAGRERWYDEIRFDVAEVVGSEVRVLEAAF